MTPPNRSPLPARRRGPLGDFVVFQVKLALDGVKDGVVFGASIVAVVLDLVTGSGGGDGRRAGFFYSVVRASERFDAWLDLHGMKGRLDERDRE